MEFITQAVDFIINFAIVLVITAAAVIALGTWMQNNHTLTVRRNKQTTASIRATIAKENAR